MSIQYLQKKYLKYHKGNGFFSGHAEALHAAPPACDRYTDTIVANLIKSIGCAGIISTVSRKDCDLNRIPDKSNEDGILEYRRAVKDIIDYLFILDPGTGKLTTPYLHLSFHGMKDEHYGPYAIEVGTLNGMSCSLEIKRWFREALKARISQLNTSPWVKVVFDSKFKGNTSIGFHRLGDEDNGYAGYGQHFHSFQLELSKSIRRKYTPELSVIFSEIMAEFQKKFVENGAF